MSDLGVLAAEGGLPCELKVKYGKANDDGELVDSITLIADCSEAVSDVTLGQPYMDDKHPGEWLPIKIGSEDTDPMTGVNKLRTLRLVDDLYPGETYVGKTFKLTATKLDGEKGEASVTILEPSEARALEAEKLSAAGALPCTLEALNVPLQGGGKGFKITVNCDEEVKGVEFTAPKPYAGGKYKGFPAGKTYKLLIVDASKLKGDEFVLTSTEGEKLKTSVTVDLGEKDSAPEEPTPATTPTTTEEPPKPDVEEPAETGESPCTITKKTFEDAGSKQEAFSLTLQCSEKVGSGELKWGPTLGEAEQEMTFGDQTFEKDEPYEILSTLVEDPVEGKVIWFEGVKEEGGQKFTSKGVKITKTN